MHWLVLLLTMEAKMDSETIVTVLILLCVVVGIIGIFTKKYWLEAGAVGTMIFIYVVDFFVNHINW